MKSVRQDTIIRLITENNIKTQEGLANALRDEGFQVTQATVSRDIKSMRLIKVTSEDGGYKYAMPETQDRSISDRLIRILSDSLISVDYAGHTIVVKTLSGSANIAAEALDTLNWPEILGTIAGDNTVFIVVRGEHASAEVADRIRKMAKQ